jgi:hypothetical protein
VEFVDAQYIEQQKAEIISRGLILHGNLSSNRLSGEIHLLIIAIHTGVLIDWFIENQSD